MIPTIQAVLVSYNTAEDTLACVATLLRESLHYDLRVAVVDNNSSDGTVERLRKEYPGVRVILNSVNVGFGKANNQVLRAYAADYYLVINPDATISRNGLESMAEFMSVHPEVGILGPRILNTEGKDVYDGKVLPTLFHFLLSASGLEVKFPRSRLCGAYCLSYLDYGMPRYVQWVTGACMLIRKEVLSSTKGFDENFFLFCEEIDLCARALQHGWRVMYWPDAIVVHVGGRAVCKNLRKRVLTTHLSKLYYTYKHHGLVQQWMLAVVMLLEAALKFVVLGVAGRIRNDQQLESKSLGYWDVLKLIFEAGWKPIKCAWP